MNSIFKQGINSNMLKTMAIIIAMVFDHVGFYFSNVLPDTMYIVCRDIGRISMTLYASSSFFYTKNFKKYISRITIFVCITQLLFVILMMINKKYMSYYTVANKAYMIGNILFSFVISLVILKILHEDLLVKKWYYNKNIALKIVSILIIIIASILIPLDYGVTVPALSVLLYYIEKFKIQVYM